MLLYDEKYHTYLLKVHRRKERGKLHFAMPTKLLVLSQYGFDLFVYRELSVCTAEQYLFQGAFVVCAHGNVSRQTKENHDSGRMVHASSSIRKSVLIRSRSRGGKIGEMNYD